jgi:hypothetical protein
MKFTSKEEIINLDGSKKIDAKIFKKVKHP